MKFCDKKTETKFFVVLLVSIGLVQYTSSGVLPRLNTSKGFVTLPLVWSWMPTEEWGGGGGRGKEMPLMLAYTDLLVSRMA